MNPIKSLIRSGIKSVMATVLMMAICEGTLADPAMKGHCSALFGSVRERIQTDSNFYWHPRIERISTAEYIKRRFSVRTKLIPMMLKLYRGELPQSSAAPHQYQWDSSYHLSNLNSDLKYLLKMAPLMTESERTSVADRLPLSDPIYTYGPKELEERTFENLRFLVRLAIYEPAAWKTFVKMQLFSDQNRGTPRDDFFFNLMFQPLVDAMPADLRRDILHLIGETYMQSKLQGERGKRPRRILDSFFNVAFRGDLFLRYQIEQVGISPVQALAKYHSFVGSYFPREQTAPFRIVTQAVLAAQDVAVSTYGSDAFEDPIFTSMLRDVSPGIYMGGSTFQGRASQSDIDVIVATTIGAVRRMPLYKPHTANASNYEIDPLRVRGTLYESLRQRMLSIFPADHFDVGEGNPLIFVKSHPFMVRVSGSKIQLMITKPFDAENVPELGSLEFSSAAIDQKFFVYELSPEELKWQSQL